MPTQEELNAAQVELDIANDNYAALADRYNKYQRLFQEYANASPEIQDRAAMAMGRALEDFYNTQDKMYAAEDRIQQAQNTVNSYNELLAQQPVQQPVARSNYNSGRKTITKNNLDGRWDTPDIINDTDNREWIPIYNDRGEVVGEQKITPDYQIGKNEFEVNEGWLPVYNDKGEIVGEQRINYGAGARNLEAARALFPSTETIPQPTSNYQPTQDMINNIQGVGGNISAGRGMTAGQYLGNVWNGLKTTYMNPNEIVYQSNSRLPGYNLGANLGRAGTVATIAAGGVKANTPTITWSRNVVNPGYSGVKPAGYSTPKWADATNYGRSTLQRSNVFTPLK